VLRSNVPLARSAGACNRLCDMIAKGDRALACVTVCCTSQSALSSPHPYFQHKHLTNQSMSYPEVLNGTR